MRLSRTELRIFFSLIKGQQNFDYFLFIHNLIFEKRKDMIDICTVTLSRKLTSFRQSENVIVLAS